MSEEEKSNLLKTDFQYRPTKTIILLNTMEVFSSVDEGAQKYNISRNIISACINHKKDFAGSDPVTREGYVWIEEKDYFENMKIELKTNSRFPPVICIEEQKIFWCPNSVKRFYGLRMNSHCKFIEHYCTQGDGKYDGKHWLYLSEYFEQHPEIQNQIAFYREHVYLEHEANQK